MVWSLAGIPRIKETIALITNFRNSANSEWLLKWLISNNNVFSHKQMLPASITNDSCHKMTFFWDLLEAQSPRLYQLIFCVLQLFASVACSPARMPFKGKDFLFLLYIPQKIPQGYFPKLIFLVLNYLKVPWRYNLGWVKKKKKISSCRVL